MRNIVNSSREKESPIKKISHHKSKCYIIKIKEDRWQAKE
jgi:hypothetical protein